MKYTLIPSLSNTAPKVKKDVFLQKYIICFVVDSLVQVMMPLRTTTPTLNSRVILRQFFDVPPVASSFPPMVERLGSTSNFPMGIFSDAKNDPIITNPWNFHDFVHGFVNSVGWIALVFFVGISLFRSNFAWWKMFSKRRGGWAIKCGFLCIETGQALVSSLLDTRRQRLPTVNQTGTNETRIQQSNKGKKTSRSTWVSIPLILVHAIAWFRNSLKRLISDSSYSETGLSACVCLGVHV